MSSPAKRPVAVARRIQAVVVLYQSDELDAKGERIAVHKSAKRGELITLSPREEARLDSLGALAAPGVSVEQMDKDGEAILDSYRAARSSVSAGAM
jgi:hypothetical protein